MLPDGFQPNPDDDKAPDAVPQWMVDAAGASPTAHERINLSQVYGAESAAQMAAVDEEIAGAKTWLRWYINQFKDTHDTFTPEASFAITVHSMMMVLRTVRDDEDAMYVFALRLAATIERLIELERIHGDETPIPPSAAQMLNEAMEELMHQVREEDEEDDE